MQFKTKIIEVFFYKGGFRIDLFIGKYLFTFSLRNHYVKKDMSLFELVELLQVNMGSLLAKNPSIAGQPVIKKGTVIIIP